MEGQARDMSLIGPIYAYLVQSTSAHFGVSLSKTSRDMFPRSIFCLNFDDDTDLEFWKVFRVVDTAHWGADIRPDEGGQGA